MPIFFIKSVEINDIIAYSIYEVPFKQHNVLWALSNECELVRVALE